MALVVDEVLAPPPAPALGHSAAARTADLERREAGHAQAGSDLPVLGRRSVGLRVSPEQPAPMVADDASMPSSIGRPSVGRPSYGVAALDFDDARRSGSRRGL